MTTTPSAKPTNAKNSPTAKETNPTIKDVPVTAPVVKDETVTVDNVTEVVKPRVSEVLSENPILADFAKKYLDAFDEISAYNKEVLAEKNSEWNPTKVLAKARELGQPTDANVVADNKIKAALNKYEAALTEFNKSRKEVIEVTSKSLGITLSVTAERNAETEAPLKEKHKFAVAIGTQLSTIAEMLTDPKISSAVTDFLASNPLPAIGRDQTRSFGKDEKATPKYRVTVVVKDADGKELVNEAGFTKAGFALTKFYERGKALKSDDLRQAWEGAGNTPEVTKTNPVEFTHNDMTFIITKTQK